MYLRQLLVFILLPVLLCAQTIPLQTIRGSVVDKSVKNPLPGANIELISKSSVSIVADATGNFLIERVPVGRQTFRISYVGYKPVVLQNILIE
jgi:hypothetical protein